MDEFHQRLIRIGLDALAADGGYALAGGYAIRSHHFIERPSDDVDLFVPIERRHEMLTATEMVREYREWEEGRVLRIINERRAAAQPSIPMDQIMNEVLESDEYPGRPQ